MTTSGRADQEIGVGRILTEFLEAGKYFTTDEIARIQGGAGRKGELGRAGMARVGCAGVAM